LEKISGKALAFRRLNGLLAEIWTKISLEFYRDAADAVFKALEA